MKTKPRNTRFATLTYVNADSDKINVKFLSCQMRVKKFKFDRKEYLKVKIYFQTD